MTTNCTMILMRGGMVFLSKEITTLPMAVTKVTDSAITKAGSSFAVTASAEQMPSTCMVMGFSRFRGEVKSFLFLVENRGSRSFTSSLIF